MPMPVYQQIAERFQSAENILLVFPWGGGNKESGDGLGSALALYRHFSKSGKRVDLAAPGFVAGRFAFMPYVSAVRPTIEAGCRYMIRIRTDQMRLKEWNCAVKDGALELYLTADGGDLEDNDVELTRRQYGYDTVVAVDAPDLPALGSLFHEHGDLFYKTPIINIDHHAENEQYGQINLVDINASATGEIVAGILKRIAPGHIDEQIATNLFAAIFLKTRGFKTPVVSSDTLRVAAELITLGARREEVMKNLFRARSLPALRLWGKALAHLRFDAQNRLAWSALTQREIMESGGDIRDLPEVIEELIFTSPDARMVALMYEEAAGRFCVLLAGRGGMHNIAHTLPWELRAATPGYASYCIVAADLISAERELSDRLLNALKLLPFY